MYIFSAGCHAPVNNNKNGGDLGTNSGSTVAFVSKKTYCHRVLWESVENWV